MKLPPILACLTAAGSLHAQDPAALTTSVLDVAGGITTGGDVDNESSLGGFGGLSSDASSVTVRAGFPGQIYDPASVAVTPGAAALMENDIRTFTAEIICDDDTLLPGSAVAWSVDSQFLSVTAAGEVTTGLLPEDFAATLTATAGGVSGTAILIATDSDPDNYRDYARDGLPDAWQVLHFGYSNSDAAPAADPDHDGQDNQTEWLAGTDPVDPDSLLHLAFASAPPAPGTRTLVFSPWLPDRTYTLEWSSALQDSWTAVSATPTGTATPGEGLITDATATESRKFYRLRIFRP